MKSLRLILSIFIVNTAFANYTLEITRGEKEGTYSYSGSFKQSGKCWWKLTKRIPAGTYHGAATEMTSSKRDGIFFYEFAPVKKDPKKPPYQGSLNHLYKGIFVHQGGGAYNSDGCIILLEDEFNKIFADITPQNQPNVTIIVKDE